LTIWCPNAPDRKTTPVGFLKREAGALGVINNPKGITKLMMPYRNPYHHVTVL